MEDKNSGKINPEPNRSRIVVDTSVFVNPGTMALFGDSVGSAVEGFLKICRRFVLEIYMPLSIFRELSTFAPPDIIKTLRTRAVVRAPDLYNMQVPAITFHTFVRELRQRVNKGLHIAEKAIKSEDAPESFCRAAEKYTVYVQSEKTWGELFRQLKSRVLIECDSKKEVTVLGRRMLRIDFRRVYQKSTHRYRRILKGHLHRD